MITQRKTGLLALLMMVAASGWTVAQTQSPDAPASQAQDYFSLSPIEIFLKVGEQNFRLLTVQITIALESGGDAARIDQLKNRIATNLKQDMQIYRFEQLQGQDGVRLFKEEALASVRRTVAPVPVPEVLVKRFLLH